MATSDVPNLSSKPCAVTVYRSGALVTRHAELTRGGAGFPGRLQLVGLPLTLDDSSLRVEIVAASGQAPVAGDVRVTLAAPGEDPQLPPPSNDELEQAKLELALANEELSLLDRASEHIDRLLPGRRGLPQEGQPPAPSPTAARLELLSFRRERSEQIAKRLPEAQDRLRLAKERLDTLRERERLASTQRNVRTNELRKAAVLTLEQPEDAGALASVVRIELSYFVPGARWAPAYTVRLDRTMTRASLELRAVVGQATGEDWRDVAMTLSSANPQQWTELPTLKAVKIGRAQRPVTIGWRPPPEGALELFADYDRDLGSKDSDERAPTRSTPAPSPAAAARHAQRPQTARERLQELAESAEIEHEETFLRPPPAPRAMPGFSPPPQQSAPSRRLSGGPPASMPPPAAAPAPMASQALSQSRSRGGFGSGSAMDEPEGVAYPGGGSGMDEPTQQEATPASLELVAGRELLDYGRLQLLPAADSKRGVLRRVDVRTLYEQVSVTSIELGPALDLVDEALRAARAVDEASVPAGHHWPADQGGFDYAYVASGGVDLQSDGCFHALLIDQRDCEATPRYVAVPRETQDVFRVVALRNPLDAPLLPGPADVYVDDKFTLTSALALTPADGRIELGLGVEQAIKIARNVSFSEEGAGMFKRSLELRHSVAIDVSNHLPRAVTVEVRERLPHVGKHVDDVQIEVATVSPPWQDFKQEQPRLEAGRLWKVEVPAAGQRKLSATWVVTIPKDHELVGGNRREA